MSKQNNIKKLRVARVFFGQITDDEIFGNSSKVTLGEESGTFSVPTIGIYDGFTLLQGDRSGGFTLRLTDAMNGKIHIGGESFALQSPHTINGQFEYEDHIQNFFDCAKDLQGVSEVGTETVPALAKFDSENPTIHKTNSVSAKIYEVSIQDGDWGVIDFGGNEIVFQFVLPPAAILQASLGGSGVVATSLRSAMSTSGGSMLFSFLLVAAAIFVIFYFTRPPSNLEDMEEDADRLATYTSQDEEKQDDMDIEEPPDEVIELEEVVAIDDDPPKAAEGDEGKFGDENLENETKLTNIDGPLTNTAPDKVGIQEALGPQFAESMQSMLSSEMGAVSEQFVGIASEGAVFEKGFGSNGMGMAGNGIGGGAGPGGGQIGGIAKRGGKGKGRSGGRPKVKRKKPKIKVEFTPGPPKAGKFCHASSIRKAVSKKSSRLRNCYERRLLADPSLSGKIIMQWKIMIDGKVKDPKTKSSTLKDNKVGRCLQRVIKGIKFAKPDGGICVIEYPFTFVSQ